MEAVLFHPSAPAVALGGAFLLALGAAWVVSRRPGAGLPRWVRGLRLPAFATLLASVFLLLLWLLQPHVPQWLNRAYLWAPRTCAEARAAGYSTARVGTPGYFRHLDADGDGVSCEPPPRRYRY